MKLAVILMGLLLLGTDAVNSVPLVDAEVPVVDAEVPDGTLIRVARQSSGSTISHGDTIALQTFARNRWLDCTGSRSTCGEDRCPDMYMEGGDWDNCREQAFKIYRQNGPGSVAVGDTVALYYPVDGEWFGCYNTDCKTSSCPGSPNPTHGFATQDHWDLCLGEVFRIYARGKNNDDIIDTDDDIVLFYPRDVKWVYQGYDGNTRKSTCLGNSKPPPASRYDGCAYETFKIWKNINA